MATSPTTDDAPTRLAITMAVANQLSSTLEIRDHLGTLPKLLVPYLGDFVIVSATDEQGEIVDVGSWHVDPDHRDEVEAYSRLRAEAGRSETLGARVIRTGTAIVVDRGVEERTRNDMQPGLARDLLLALAPQAVALLPMLTRGRTVGLLSAFARAAFSEAQLELARDVAARAALALDNALAYARADAARRSAESAARRLALLAEVGETLAGIEDPDVALGRLARMLVPALGTWSTVVVVDDGGRLRDVGWAHRDPTLADLVAAHAAGQSRDPAADSTLATCLRTGEVVRRAGADGAASPLAPDTATTVTIPLVARGKAYGAVTLGSTTPASDDDVDLAVEVVRRATPVVDSARAAQEVARVAESLQRDLLTVGPVPDHLVVRSRYRPSHAGRQVGGDWYDAFAVRGGGAVVAIGDVMGHDVAAIAAMAQLRTFVRAFAWAEAPSPVEVLRATDAASAGLGPGVFATAVLAVLGPPRPDGRVELTWSNAGHLPPVVVGADGRVHLLDGAEADVPLGVAPRRPRHETTRLLAPGDTLVLFTDGLVERRDRDLAVGLAAVVAVLTSLGAEPLDVVLDTLLGTLLSGVGQLDDVAALALRVGGERPRPPAPAATSDDEVHHLPVGPTASAVARYHVGRFTADLPTGVREDALVLVSELAGNAVRHGAAPIALRLRRVDGGVEVGVRDTGAARVGGPVAGSPAAGPHRESGRGLVIVAGLAARWWVETSADVGKTVWFRLATAEG